METAASASLPLESVPKSMCRIMCNIYQSCDQTKNDLENWNNTLKQRDTSTTVMSIDDMKLELDFINSLPQLRVAASRALNALAKLLPVQAKKGLLKENYVTLMQMGQSPLTDDLHSGGGKPPPQKKIKPAPAAMMSVVKDPRTVPQAVLTNPLLQQQGKSSQDMGLCTLSEISELLMDQAHQQRNSTSNNTTTYQQPIPTIQQQQQDYEAYYTGGEYQPVTPVMDEAHHQWEAPQQQRNAQEMYLSAPSAKANKGKK